MHIAPGHLRARLSLAAATLFLLPLSLAAQAPGRTNTLTDVAGIKVGHYQRVGDGYQTGTTVVRTEQGATAGIDVQGGAPGTRESDLLAPGGLVTQAHAIVLSGGSAYGLDSATGVMRWLEEHGHGFSIAGGVVPIVPAAILFDLGRGGDFSKRPDAEFGYLAAEAASEGAVPMGRAGAGTGARYGLGSASVVLANGYTVAAIVGLNSAGSPVNPETCVPYGAFLELDGEFGLVPPDPAECEAARNAAPRRGDPFNTTIAWSPPMHPWTRPRSTGWPWSPTAGWPAPFGPSTTSATEMRSSGWPPPTRRRGRASRARSCRPSTMPRRTPSGGRWFTRSSRGAPTAPSSRARAGIGRNGGVWFQLVEATKNACAWGSDVNYSLHHVKSPLHQPSPGGVSRYTTTVSTPSSSACTPSQ